MNLEALSKHEKIRKATGRMNFVSALENTQRLIATKQTYDQKNPSSKTVGMFRDV